MAAHGWRTDRPVKEVLFKEGYRFDFYQAVKLLEIIHPETVPVGEGSVPEKETVNFKSAVCVHADFSEADLTDSCFKHATVSFANFKKANFKNADFSDAEFSMCNFTGAKNIDANQLCKADELSENYFDKDIADEVKRNCPKLLETNYN